MVYGFDLFPVGHPITDSGLREDVGGFVRVGLDLAAYAGQDVYKRQVKDYVQRIYEDVQSVGSLIRTAVPAVNALLSAKSADCAERGIAFDAEIQSSWEEIPVAGWEMCRIIGNLVDNAMDALEEAATPGGRIRVVIGESIPGFSLAVENNGPEIPRENKRSIFQPGFTTKSFGHGNGLSIVSDLVEKYGGRLDLESGPERTRFSCTFPRLAKERPEAEP